MVYLILNIIINFINGLILYKNNVICKNHFPNNPFRTFGCLLFRNIE